MLEALEDQLARSLTSQQDAIRNWAKIGLRVQMVQAFNMLYQLDNDPQEETRRCNGFIIDRNSRAKTIWNAINDFFLVVSFFIVPWNIAFG